MEITGTDFEKPDFVRFLQEPIRGCNALVRGENGQLDLALVRVTSDDAQNKIVFLLNEIALALNHECAIRPESAIRIPNLRALRAAWYARHARNHSTELFTWTFYKGGDYYRVEHTSSTGRLSIGADHYGIILDFRTGESVNYSSFTIYSNLNVSWRHHGTDWITPKRVASIAHLDWFALEGRIRQRVEDEEFSHSLLITMWDEIIESFQNRDHRSADNTKE